MAHAADSKTRSRRWCFTSFEDKAPDAKSTGYLCYQRETCPTTGKQHWQGYVEFGGAGGIGHVAAGKRLGIQCHFTKSNGTASDNRKYCSKPETAVANTFREFGEPGMQGVAPGSRTIADLVANGATNLQIAEANPADYMRLHKGIDALRRALMPQRDPKAAPPEGFILWGTAGTGKSRWVYDNYPVEEIFAKNAGKWWNGYTGQRVVAINEFKFAGDVNREYLLNLCDRYPFMVEDKGGLLPVSFGVLVLTMNGNPRDVLGAAFDDALLRRFKVIEFAKDGPKEDIDTRDKTEWLLQHLFD